MSETPEPDAALEIRASDLDRERFAEQLRDAAGDGRLTMDELEERLELVYAAKTYAQLEPLVKDLPAPGAAQAAGAALAAPAHGSLARVGGTPSGRHRSLAIIGGARRRGTWVVPKRYTSFAFWGGVQLDMTEASFADREVVVNTVAIMGGIQIIVPEDVIVQVEGIGVMGGYDEPAARNQPPAGSPVLRVTGFAFWGGVQVTRRPSKPEPDNG
jgi:hypothetical protein